RNKVRLHDPVREHVCHLTGASHGVMLLSPWRINIMRAALLQRLNATRPIFATNWMQIMAESNDLDCPLWLAQISVEEWMEALEVRLEGSTLVPCMDDPLDEFFPEKYPQG
nr:hypothetical protein [Chloroflexota bacterium]